MKMIYFYSEFAQRHAGWSPVVVSDHPVRRPGAHAPGWDFKKMSMADKAILLHDDGHQEVVKCRDLNRSTLSDEELAWALLQG